MSSLWDGPAGKSACHLSCIAFCCWDENWPHPLWGRKGWTWLAGYCPLLRKPTQTLKGGRTTASSSLPAHSQLPLSPFWKICISCVWMISLHVGLYNTHNGSRKEHRIPWNWSYRKLWATLWVMGTESRSSARERAEMPLSAKPSFQPSATVLFF